jgi:hypothetical protein
MLIHNIVIKTVQYFITGFSLQFIALYYMCVFCVFLLRLQTHKHRIHILYYKTASPPFLLEYLILIRGITARAHTKK